MVMGELPVDRAVGPCRGPILRRNGTAVDNGFRRSLQQLCRRGILRKMASLEQVCGFLPEAGNIGNEGAANPERLDADWPGRFHRRGIPADVAEAAAIWRRRQPDRTIFLALQLVSGVAP